MALSVLNICSAAETQLPNGKSQNDPVSFFRQGIAKRRILSQKRKLGNIDEVFVTCEPSFVTLRDSKDLNFSECNDSTEKYNSKCFLLESYKYINFGFWDLPTE